MYLNSKNKRVAREFLFSKLKGDNIIGLAGPNINEYLEWCNKFKNVEIWEKDNKILLHQFSTIHTSKKVEFHFGDIITAEPQQNTVHDLDFCCTIKNISNEIKKFNNYIMTFSLRGVSQDVTIHTFFNKIDERVIKYTSSNNPINHIIFTTNKGKYIYLTYRDSSPMCCFLKLSKTA